MKRRCAQYFQTCNVHQVKNVIVKIFCHSTERFRLKKNVEIIQLYFQKYVSTKQISIFPTFWFVIFSHLCFFSFKWVPSTYLVMNESYEYFVISSKWMKNTKKNCVAKTLPSREKLVQSNDCKISISWRITRAYNREALYCAKLNMTTHR